MTESASVLNRKSIHIAFWSVVSSLIIASIIGSVAIITQWASLPDIVDSNKKTANQALKQSTYNGVMIGENQKGIKELTVTLSSLIKQHTEKSEKTAVALTEIAVQVRQSNKLGDKRNVFMEKLVETQTKIALEQASRTSKIESAIEHTKDKEIHNGR